MCMPASKYKFLEPVSYDHIIGDATDGGGKIGELRVKPSSILWKPKGKQQFFSVPLDLFSKWIEENGKRVDR